MTTAPTSTVVIADGTPAPNVPADEMTRLGAADPARLPNVPKFLQDTYSAVTVPADIIIQALSGKIEVFPITDEIPFFNTLEQRKEWQRGMTGRTLTVGEAVHRWRLNEAARLHAVEEMKRANGYYIVDCPACGGRVYANTVGTAILPSGGTFTGCSACHTDLAEELRRREHDAHPLIVARRQAITDALKED